MPLYSPGPSASSSRPPCEAATAWTRDRPRPAPGSLRLFSRRTKRWTTRAPVGLGHAGAGVGDRELQLARRGAPRPQHDRPALGRIFDGVVEQVGQGLGQELAIAPDGQARDDLGLEVQALVLAREFVELGHVGGQFRGVEGAVWSGA